MSDLTAILYIRNGSGAVMAGDRSCNGDWEVTTTALPKVWRVGAYCIGFAGCFDAQASLAGLNLPEPKKKLQAETQAISGAIWHHLKVRDLETLDKLGTELLIARANRVWYMCGGTAIPKTQKCLAIGSGGAWAQGWAAGSQIQSISTRARKALAYASKCVGSVKGPFDVLKIG